MLNLNAKNLTLDEVHEFLSLEQGTGISFESLLTLEPLTEFEQQEINQIRSDFRYYLNAGKVLEGQVNFLLLAPLLRLAGFYHPPICLTLEQDIAKIEITDEDIHITGRLDLLAAKRGQSTPLWMVVIETKNSFASPRAGLPQLLTYAYESLSHQPSVLGLTTNGESFRFVYLQAGEPTTYHFLPELNLIDDDRALQLLQVLKAIRVV
jgi:hypothetical protein